MMKYPAQLRKLKGALDFHKKQEDRNDLEFATGEISAPVHAARKYIRYKFVSVIERDIKNICNLLVKDLLESK